LPRGSVHADHAVVFSRQVLIINEELLKFLPKLLSKIVDVFNVGPAVILFLYVYDPIIPFSILLITLLTFNNADYPAFQYASGKSGLIDQY